MIEFNVGGTSIGINIGNFRVILLLIVCSIWAVYRFILWQRYRKAPVVEKSGVVSKITVPNLKNVQHPDDIHARYDVTILCQDGTTENYRNIGRDIRFSIWEGAEICYTARAHKLLSVKAKAGK